MAANPSSRFKADVGYTKPAKRKKPKMIKLPMPKPLKPIKPRKR